MGIVLIWLGKNWHIFGTDFSSTDMAGFSFFLVLFPPFSKGHGISSSGSCNSLNSIPNYFIVFDAVADKTFLFLIGYCFFKRKIASFSSASDSLEF